LSHIVLDSDKNFVANDLCGSVTLLLTIMKRVKRREWELKGFLPRMRKRTIIADDDTLTLPAPD